MGEAPVMRGSLYSVALEGNDVVVKIKNMDDYRINCVTREGALDLFDYWHHLMLASHQALVYGWQ